MQERRALSGGLAFGVQPQHGFQAPALLFEVIRFRCQLEPGADHEGAVERCGTGYRDQEGAPITATSASESYNF